jgi:DNA mismatch endonuclease (patch repair protein)
VSSSGSSSVPSPEPDGRTVVVGPGIRAPYPVPSTPAATKIALANRRKDTRPEVALRSALHRMGLRFRKAHTVRAGDVLVRPDVVFTRHRVAVFVDGCFWHCCPEHGRIPKSNLDYWIPKLQANVTRDRRVTAALRRDGWHVVRVWEHEPPSSAAAVIAGVVARA